jgi:hypothetical protein
VLGLESAIIDGKTVVLNEAGLSDLDALRKATGGREQDFYFVAFDFVLDGIRHNDIGLSGIVDVETCRDRCQPRRCFYSCARVAKSINVTAGFDRSIKAYDLFCQQIDAP